MKPCSSIPTATSRGGLLAPPTLREAWVTGLSSLHLRAGTQTLQTARSPASRELEVSPLTGSSSLQNWKSCPQLEVLLWRNGSPISGHNFWSGIPEVPPHRRSPPSCSTGLQSHSSGQCLAWHSCSAFQHRQEALLSQLVVLTHGGDLQQPQLQQWQRTRSDRYGSHSMHSATIVAAAAACKRAGVPAHAPCTRLGSICPGQLPLPRSLQLEGSQCLSWLEEGAQKHHCFASTTSGKVR
jgi:hypothetical protein